jgi:hypothetical protein
VTRGDPGADLRWVAGAALGAARAGDTRRPRSCPALGGGCWSPWDTCRPRSWPEPVTHGAPGADLRREAGAAPGAALSWSLVGCFW